MHRIALVGLDDADVARIVNAQLPQGTAVEKNSRTAGVHMDPAIAAVVVPAIASVASAAITAIATVWAAGIAARQAKAAGNPPKAGPPMIEIETLAKSVVIRIDQDMDANIRKVIPEPVGSILTVRFRGGGG